MSFDNNPWTMKITLKFPFYSVSESSLAHGQMIGFITTQLPKRTTEPMRDIRFRTRTSKFRSLVPHSFIPSPINRNDI